MTVLQTKEQPQRTGNIYLKMSQIHNYSLTNILRYLSIMNLRPIFFLLNSIVFFFFLRQGKNKNFLPEVKVVDPSY